MTKVADASAEACGRALAMLEDRCPCLNPDGTQNALFGCDHCGNYWGHERCIPCNGTGKVARYPMLWRPCDHEGVVSAWDKIVFVDSDGTHWGHQRTRRDGAVDWVCVCQGRGCLPVVTTDAMLEAVWSAGLVVIWWSDEEVRLQHPGFHNPVYYGYGKGTPALAQALCAANGIKEATDAS